VGILATMRKLLIFLLLGISSCKSLRRDGGRPEPSFRTPDLVRTMNNNTNDDELGPSSTTLTFGGSEITLTVGDVKAMQAALLTYLASVDTSQVEDRDYLIASTEGGLAWIDTDGVVRINSWVLQVGPHGLILRCRMPAPEGADVLHAYVASLVREDSWRVVRIASERIRRRR
jgi:hypothetical protein